MKYSRTGDFPCHKLLNILQVVKEAPGDYLAYASHADSIYPITGVDVGIVDDVVSFSSIETYGRAPRAVCTAAQLLQQINRMLEEEKPDPYIDACLEAARDTDPELELQMTEPCEISGWAVDDTCRHFYLIAGEAWGWT